MRHRDLPLLAFLLAALSLFGCSPQDNDTTLDMGSVSIGTQLIDLKKARDSGAISGTEYRALKADLLMLMNNAARLTGNHRNDETDVNHPQNEVPNDDSDDDSNNDDQREKADEDSGFLF